MSRHDHGVEDAFQTKCLIVSNCKSFEDGGNKNSHHAMQLMQTRKTQYCHLLFDS
jgi:hypothetical protein